MMMESKILNFAQKFASFCISQEVSIMKKIIHRNQKGNFTDLQMNFIPTEKHDRTKSPQVASSPQILMSFKKFFYFYG